MNTVRTLLLALSGALSAAACASPKPPPAAPAPPPVVVESAVAPAAPPPAPDPGPPKAECVARDGETGCFAADDYRTWLCDQHDATAAVAMFAKGTPWVRAYVSRDLEAWDPGRRSREGRSKLALDEEVLVLHAYRPQGGVVVVGGTSAEGWSSVDAVRLDGTCVSLMADEITTRRPPAPRRSPLAWDRLTQSAKSALLATPAVKKRADAATKACAGKPERPCTKAREQLADAIVAAQASE